MELAIICEQCLKFARVECVQESEYEPKFLVECHGIARVARIGNYRNEKQVKLLWSQVQYWYSVENAAQEISEYERQIAECRRRIEFWRRVK